MATPEEITQDAVNLMEAAAELTIGLAENEEAYDLRYIASQLAKCSSYGERVADMLARLSQYRVAVMVKIAGVRNDLEIAQDEAQELHKDERPVSRREALVARATRKLKHTVRAWENVDLILREVKADIGRRGDLIKRLDSDLRLHEKIIEAKITAGAIGIGGLTGDPRFKGNVKDLSRPDPDPDTSAGEVELS